MLTLLCARPAFATPQDPVGEHDLGALARRLTLANVLTKQVLGDPVEALLRSAIDADLITVGHRALHPAHRKVSGGTSHAVARWSPIPVVVVPEAWIQPTMASAPIVAGVRPMNAEEVVPDEPDRNVIDFAFARASAMQVPLVVVCAWDIPTLQAWSPTDIERVRRELEDAMELRLVAWREAYPLVEVAIRSVAENAAQALLDASLTAQLVVVGRHHGETLSGRLGSTAGDLLAHSTRPVAVVPAGTRDELVRGLDMRRALTDRPWAPMF
jgi:nucleotide-binding universal stress UspA family protein